MEGYTRIKVCRWKRYIPMIYRLSYIETGRNEMSNGSVRTEERRKESERGQRKRGGLGRGRGRGTDRGRGRWRKRVGGKEQ